MIILKQGGNRRPAYFDYMRYNMAKRIRILVIFIWILTSLSACANLYDETTIEQTVNPTMTLNSTPMPTVAPINTPVPITEDEQRVQNWSELEGALYSSGYTVMTKCIYDPFYDDEFYIAAESVFNEMLEILDYMHPPVKEPPAQDGAEYYQYYATANEQDVTDTAYVATVMNTMIEHFGWLPQGTKELGLTVLTDDDVRSLLKICFADFTDDKPLPEPEDSPEYSEERFKIQHIDGKFRFTAPEFWGSRHHSSAVITSMGLTTLPEYGYGDKEVFYMWIVDLSGFNDFVHGSGYIPYWRQVYLVRNDEPDTMGINWQIAKIINLPLDKTI